ncbi:MAG: hypothetical protein NT175_06065 [Bacteroidetes bacterium]|nr:hypothetical protein [Bacteroidota bacterium]
MFGYILGIESPIKLSPNCNGYVTPGISYESRKADWDGGDDKDNELAFYLDLTFFIPNHDYSCDIGNGCSKVNERYQQGYALMGVTSWIGLSLNKYTLNYDITEEAGMNMDENETDFRVGLNGYYYVINNLAVGANITLNTYKYKSKEDVAYPYENSGSRFIFMPQVLYNLPFNGCLRNFFVNGGFGFGSNNSSYKTGSNPADKTKENITAYYVGAGYNYFFTDYLAFTPKIGFKSQKNKIKDQDYKVTRSGLVIDFGLNYFFGNKGAVKTYLN